VEYFCIDLKEFFFKRSLNLHLHIWQYFLVFLSQTSNTALKKKKSKEKLILLSSWVIWNISLGDCVKIRRSLGFPTTWQSQVKDSSVALVGIRWGSLYLIWATEDTNSSHPTYSYQTCTGLSLAKHILVCSPEY